MPTLLVLCQQTFPSSMSASGFDRGTDTPDKSVSLPWPLSSDYLALHRLTTQIKTPTHSNGRESPLISIEMSRRDRGSVNAKPPVEAMFSMWRFFLTLAFSGGGRITLQ